MFNRPLQKIMFVGGVGLALVGLYAASQTSEDFRWDSIVTILMMAAGIFAASIGFVSLLQADEEEARTAAAERYVLPGNLVPLVFGGFVGAIAVVAGLVVGHYIGRNEGFITFIFAFVLANLVFGLGLALGRAPSYR